MGPVLTPRLRVNQEPPFVPFKRQLTSQRAQRRPPCRIRNVPPTTFDVISHAGSTARCASPGLSLSPQFRRSYSNRSRRSTSFGESPVPSKAASSSSRTRAGCAETTDRNLSFPTISAPARSVATRLLRSDDKRPHSETPKIPRSALTYPSLGPAIIDSSRLLKTCSIGWSVASCIQDSDSQSIEDRGLIETSDERTSRRLLAAMFLASSACNAAEATSGTDLQVLLISSRFSDELGFAHGEGKMHDSPASSD